MAGNQGISRLKQDRDECMRKYSMALNRIFHLHRALDYYAEMRVVEYGFSGHVAQQALRNDALREWPAPHPEKTMMWEVESE